MGVIEQRGTSLAPVEQTEDRSPPGKPDEGSSLKELIQRARSASGEEQNRLCTLVNRALNEFSAASDKDRQAARLLQMLDDEALHGLEDVRRVPCRAVAVNALLTIGYPWALQLKPEDVQFLREQQLRPEDLQFPSEPAKAGFRMPWGRVAGGLASLGSLAFFGLVFGEVGGACLPWLRQPLGGCMASALAFLAVGSLGVAVARPWSAKDAARVGPTVRARFAAASRASRWILGLSTAATAGLAMADGLTHSRPILVQLLVLLVTVAGALGAVFPRDPPTQT